MAVRNPKVLANGTLATTILTEIYSPGVGVTASPGPLVLTNTTAAIIPVNIFINDGIVDRLLERVKIPGGAGQRMRVLSVSDGNLTSSDSIKLQAENTNEFNHFLSGSEIS